MATDRSGEVLKGKYTLIRQIGRGGFADVWLARDVDYLRREVAVKILHQGLTKDEDNVRRFFNEAKLVGSIDARNIVRVSDYGVSNGHHFLVMEYLQGPTLRESLRQRATGVIDCSEALSIIEQICDGLAIAANTYSVAHRDLKPENIFLSYTRSDVHVTIVDFGIAKIVDEQALNSFASGPTTGLIGTPIYMAPELTKRLHGDEFPAEMYFQADIYSLGVMLYEMLTGSPPFEGPDAEVLCQHLAVMPMRPRLVHPGLELSESVEALVMRCLEKSPHKRYQSAEELGEAIRSLPLELSSEVDDLEDAVTRPRSSPPTGAVAVVGQGIAPRGTKPLEIVQPLREPEEGVPCVPSRKAMRIKSCATAAYVPRGAVPVGSQGAATAQVIQLHVPECGPQLMPECAVNRPTEDHGVVPQSRSTTARTRVRVNTNRYARPPRMPIFTKIVIASTLVTALVSMCTIGSAILVFSSAELQGAVFGPPPPARPQLTMRRNSASADSGPPEKGANRGTNSGVGAAPAPASFRLAGPENGPVQAAGGIAGFETGPTSTASADGIVPSADAREKPAGNVVASSILSPPRFQTAGNASAASAPVSIRPRSAQTMADKAAKIQARVLENCTLKAYRGLENKDYPVHFSIDIRSGKPTKVDSRVPKGLLDDEDCVLRYARSQVSFKGVRDISSDFEYTYRVRAKPGSAALMVDGSGRLTD